ncbi:MAG: hypothetical protein HKN74_01120 [Acidimicrobiia bacterium]|nr:hypothetical protein [Acidimicrobiia bacterium]NNF08865.1 hypothetical protein [Acidimicrobiia bacterium]
MRLKWGPVLIGAGAGFLIGSVVGVAMVGLLPGGTGLDALLVLLSFLIEFGAGFVAGWLSPGSEALNGSQAALLLYALASLIALTGGASLLVLIVGAALALAIGTMGGILAVALRAD